MVSSPRGESLLNVQTAYIRQGRDVLIVFMLFLTGAIHTRGFPASYELSAQTAPEISTGETLRGALESSDPVLEGGVPFDTWIYRAESGRRVSMEVNSREFSPRIIMFSGSEYVTAGLEATATGNRGSAFFTPPESGSYEIRVTSSNQDGYGDYSLSIRSASDRPPGASGVILPDWAEIYPGGGDPSEKYALVVGISDYPGSLNDLSGSANDADSFRELLVGTFDFPESNIVTLKNSEAKRDYILNAIDRHLGQAGPDGVAVFYFSGHGTRIENQPDSDIEADGMDEVLSVWGWRENSLIRDDELGFHVTRLEAGRMLLVVDACHSGTVTRAGFTDSLTARSIDSEDIKESLEVPEAATVIGGSPVLGRIGETSLELPEPSSHVLLTASAETESAFEDRSFRQGVFSRFLIPELRRSPENTTFVELMDIVRDRASSRVSSLVPGYQQTPQVEGELKSMTIDEFLGRNRDSLWDRFRSLFRRSGSNSG